MQKILLFIACGLIIISLSGCGNNATDKNLSTSGGDNEMTENSKGVVLYFSATGSTEKVAKKISEVTNSDIIEIVPKDEYTSDDLDYNDDNSRANKEMNDVNARPEIKNEINIKQYDTIYIGYPIWWGTNPKIILTLLDNINFDGKNVALFCTSGGSGIETSVEELKEYEPNINWLGGKRFSTSSSESDISSWINSLNI